jgi:hypothetical protein
MPISFEKRAMGDRHTETNGASDATFNFLSDTVWPGTSLGLGWKFGFFPTCRASQSLTHERYART